MLYLMKYYSRGWTTQKPQVFCGRTKQNISVLHAAQRSLKSLPPGTGTASKSKGPFSTSHFVISEKLSISKPASYCFGLCLCKAWRCRSKQGPPATSLCKRIWRVFLFMNLFTRQQELKRPPEICAAHPSGHSKPSQLISSGLGKLISLDIQGPVCLG